MAFTPEQLNFFKFSAVVLDAFPVALRKVFVFMWDNQIATTPGVPKWDDSVTVLNMLIANEGGGKKVPMLNKSYKEWDCTALFKATLFAQTFAMSHGTGSTSTLSKLYVKYHSSSTGTFHPSVISPTGNTAETYALALDQLRLLRHTLCHPSSTKELDKVTFDHYITLAKDAFTALGQSTTKIDEIGNLGEEDFPTSRLKQVEDELKKEKDAAIKFKQIDDHLNKIESQVEDVKTAVTDVKTRVEDVGSDVKDAKSGVTDVKTRMEDVGSDVKDVKKEVADVKSQLKDVRSDVKDVKTGVTDVKTRVEDVGSDVKDVKKEVADVKTQVKDVGSDVKDLKSGVTDMKTRVEDVGSNVKNMKTEVADVKTQMADVGSLAFDVKELKTDVVDIKQALQAESSRGPRSPDSCIPDMIPHFVGRLEECRAILDQLTNGSTRLVDVWGPPGFGKTSVAIDVAHQLRQMKIPVYFTSLRGMTTKDDLVSKLLGIFVDAKQAFHVSPSDWLIQCLQQQQTPFVLILDNADDVLESGDTKVKGDMLRFTEDILAQCSHIKLLITSRESHEYLSYKFPIHLERVGVLDDSDSGYLVKTLLPDVSERDRNNIVKACGQVPLAMRLMCSMVREENVSVSKLLEETKISPLVEVLDNERFSSDARLKTIINTSFERLTAHERDIFVSLAVFPGRFGIDEAKEVLNLKTIPQTKKRIASLKRKALIECTGDFESFAIHSLLRSFVEEMIINDQMQVTRAVFSTAQRRFYDYNLSNYEAANEKYLTGRSNEALAAFQSRRENVILSLLNGVKDEKLYDKVVKVLSKGELFLYTVLINEDVLFNTIFDAAVEEAKANENWVDKENLLAAKSFEQWGWFSSDRQTWGYSLYSDCSCVADCPVKLLCYHGIHQILCGKVDEGVWLLKNCVKRLSAQCDENVLKSLVYQLLAVCGQIEQEDETVSEHLKLHTSESRSTSTNDEDCFLLTKLVDDCVFSFVRLKLFAKGRRGGDHNGIFKLMIGVGEMFGRCHADGLGLSLSKFYKECVKSGAWYYDKALLNPPWKLLGVEPTSVDVNQSTFTVMETIQDYDFAVGWIYYLLNLYSIVGSIPGGERRDLHKKNTSPDFVLKLCVFVFKTSIENTLKTHELVPGIDFKDLAVTYHNFGTLLKLANDYSGALAYYQHAIRVRNEHAGNPVDIAGSLTSIGCVYFEMNKDIEAEKAFQSALELRKQTGVYDHLDTAVIYDTLANNHLPRGNFTKALVVLQEALVVREKHLGEHPDTAANLNDIGYAHFMKGDFESGREEFIKAVDMYTKLGDKGIDSAISCNNLAKAYFHLGNLDLARQFCQEALVRRLELLGEHIDTAETLHWKGLIHAKMEDNKSAVEAFQKASKMRSNLLGDHEDTAESFGFLGQSQYHLDEQESAVKAFQEAARIRSNTLGNQEGILLIESYRKTAVIYRWLGIAQNGLGDLRGALESIQESLRLTREAPVEDLDTDKALQLLNSIYESLSAGELDCD